MSKSSTGVVIGRFMPPHLGHQYLFDFGANYADALTIFVCTLPDEPIPGALRFNWVSRMNPGARVIHITERIPEAGRDNPRSHSIWAQTIEPHMPEGVTYVFASEPYGWELADALGARFISVDPARHVFPISATRIRRNPFQTWRFIPGIVRSYFVRRIAVIGERGAGEGTFAHALAEVLKTVTVQNYLTYWESLGAQLATEADLAHVLSAQMAAQRALTAHANGVMVVCSDPVALATEWTSRGRTLPDWYEKAVSGATIKDEGSSGGRTPVDHYLLVDLSEGMRDRIIPRIEAARRPYDIVDSKAPDSIPFAVDLAQSLMKPT
jgi:NadR type nicotinamide-nucleotide adenylyltransferase